MRLALVVAGLVVLGGVREAAAQIPRLPGARGGLQPVRRDTVKDSSAVKWPTPDSIAAKLLSTPGYNITRYQGDTAFFNAQNHALDLLAAPKRRAVVDRDSEIVVSDSGIYYTESNRHVTTGGHYVLSNPGSGQADIKGIGRVDYDLAERSARVTRARLPVNNGDMWYLDVDVGRVIMDTTAKGKSAPTMYAGRGSITSCDDSIPDYHFEYHSAKRASNNTIVAAPAILYIRDVPVMWLPFLFSDAQGGRHSGILPPQFGLGDIVRNSPSYRRDVEHVGYYWAMSDYMDFSTWLDWRSSAGAVAGDPGYLRLNGDWDYKWLDRFLSGRIGTSYTMQRDGSTNLALSWSHQEDFGRDSHLNTDLNYVTNTTIQRQNAFNPYAALATISSQATYQEKIGPASLSIGGTRKQYPGRQQVDQTFPTLSLTSTPISIGSWFTWTPGFSFNRSDTYEMDQPGLGQFTYGFDPTTGLRDSSLSKARSSSQSTTSFDTPIQIFGWNFRNSFHVNQQRNDFPQQFTIYDVNTGDSVASRVYAATYRTDVDWTPDFTLPSLGHNRFNLTPSLTLANVDPGPFWVATERTDGQFVHQEKRLSGGISASPTLFGFFPGFGPFERIRHSISPTISYSWAPAATVSDDYLKALGRSRKGYLGDLQQSAITFGLNQNFEAKVRPKNDTNPDAGQKIQLLSLNFTPISYDFVRASTYAQTHAGHVGWSGVSTDSWGYSARSDLLPGFDFSTNYSLFQGDVMSDTAKFAPYLTSVSASFSISKEQNPFTVLSRLFGKAVPEPNKAGQTSPKVNQPPDSTTAMAIANQPVAGNPQNGNRFILPVTQGWKAQFTFSRSSPRPPVGGPGANIIDFDPTQRCAQIANGNPFLEDACLAQQRAQPTTDTPVASTTAGGPAYRIPPTTSLNGDIGFNLTPKWAAHWTTTYDFEHHEFASHIVQLQRDLHDWRAIFGFTQSPNGNFAFTFTIALKAEPDLKFDYNRATVRSGVPFY